MKLKELNTTHLVMTISMSIFSVGYSSQAANPATQEKRAVRELDTQSGYLCAQSIPHSLPIPAECKHSFPHTHTNRTGTHN